MTYHEWNFYTFHLKVIKKLSFIIVFGTDTLKQRYKCDPFFQYYAYLPTAAYKLLPKWQ